MAKQRPLDRWRGYVLERVAAMITRAAADLAELRREGLALLGREDLLSNEEWWDAAKYRMMAPEYLAFKEKCRLLGERFGLAEWTVTMTCLLKDFRPEESPFALEQAPPKVRLITSATDESFLRWLIYETWRLNNEDGWFLQAYVVQTSGPTETTLIQVGVPVPPERPLAASQLPPLDTAARTRVEVPPGFPPEAGQLIHQAASAFHRELLRRLGYPVPKRVRVSQSLREAARLRLEKQALPPGEAGDIADESLGDDEFETLRSGKLQKAVRAARHRAKAKLARHDQQRGGTR